MRLSHACEHSRKELKTIFIIFALIQLSNADVIQHIALSCGTIGFGAKYSIYYHLFGVDFGIPIYYMGDENKNNDTITTTHEFKCNIYFSVNLIVAKKQNYDFAVGIAVLSNLKYVSQRITFDNVNTGITNGLYTDPQIGPSLEYIGKNTNHEKLFSVQLFPIGYYPKNSSHLKLTTSIQLNYYIKKLGQ